MSVETFQNTAEEIKSATPLTDELLAPVVKIDPNEAQLVRGMFDKISKGFAEVQAYYDLGGMEDAARDKLTVIYGHKIAMQLPYSVRTSLGEDYADVCIDVLEENARSHANQALEDVMALSQPLEIISEELLDPNSSASRDRYVRAIETERDESVRALGLAQEEVASLKRQVAALQGLVNDQADMLNGATGSADEQPEGEDGGSEEHEDLDVYERQRIHEVAARLGGTVTSITIRTAASEKQKIAS